MSTHNLFAGRIRIRVCGLLEEDGRVLLVKINPGTGTEPFWMPPGGGVEFGERLEDALIREFREETGLLVEVTGFAYVREFIRLPWHAIELYYHVRRVGGTLKLGTDPEIPADRQMLLDLGWGEWDLSR